MLKFYKAWKLAHQLIIIYVENQPCLSNHESHLMKDVKVFLVPFFIPDFNILGCELDNLQLTPLY